MNHQEVFKVRTKRHFISKALEIFLLQSEKNSVYRKYVRQLGVNPDQVKSVEQIPFLPIEFFKTQKVKTVMSHESRVLRKENSALFLSSGTTGVERSKHYVSDLNLYEASFRKCFDLFYGDVAKSRFSRDPSSGGYSILAFLPSYYENKKSSLLYMVNNLMKRSGKKESRFYKTNEQKTLFQTIEKLLAKKKKVILFGVSYALLDLTPPAFRLSPLSQGRGVRGEVIVLETGGMKGKREEITREELHKTLCEKFGVKKIHSEYGMTELLSQAYSKGEGIFNCPPWMKVLIRDPNDPFSFLPAGKTGAINIIDLANINSCSFIATQDVGRVYKNGSFEVLGRMDNSDLRGCNLLAE